eukprot:CAMPEP_0206574378 /NCGR_PEP_ID=MMETSP0325_2-20121206/29412_1 /ASSEMBLY_ACC=CAM_ASM_000347 /TAXON_ID=2866 /ORGANISM="Crypthecodinium cohnii, Strain Seligo" /LENGTH=118 /DNA_ID=CAMNT_0054078975 /DNA_START=377 /DNA_END=730 /DNA_ORIENTATION=-
MGLLEGNKDPWDSSSTTTQHGPVGRIARHWASLTRSQVDRDPLNTSVQIDTTIRKTMGLLEGNKDPWDSSWTTTQHGPVGRIARHWASLTRSQVDRDPLNTSVQIDTTIRKTMGLLEG